MGSVLPSPLSYCSTSESWGLFQRLHLRDLKCLVCNSVHFPLHATFPFCLKKNIKRNFLCVRVVYATLVQVPEEARQELELGTVVSCLMSTQGTKVGFSGKAATRAFNHGAISPVPSRSPLTISCTRAWECFIDCNTHSQCWWWNSGPHKGQDLLIFASVSLVPL